ncbi:hypothetical protein [Metallibacterium scheffleri]|uniref:hypothetical protein n=2 Tax=Metallibacterium TaxID=1218803 RepID=UPI0026E965CE|nr:hypothetical protein [Metallibacterium scheffleri]MBW8075270.1 hypothetical protein [Metallibacterium scheffleri]
MDNHFISTADHDCTLIADECNTTVAALPAAIGAVLGHAAVPVLLSADDAYRVAEQALDEYLQAHAGLDHVEARGDGEEDLEERLRKLPALGITVTPGVGKTHAAGRVAMRAARAGVPVLIIVPTKALAHSYVEAINQASGAGAATEYVARQSPEAVSADAALSPWLCHKLEDVRRAGEANHRPGQSLCRECPHGRKAEYECGIQEREQRALKWFQAHGIDPWDYAPCHFLYEGLPSVKTAQILVAPAAAFSEALAFHNGVDEHGRFVRTQRFVIVDEAIAPGKLVRAGLVHVEQWITKLALIQKLAGEKIAKWHGLTAAAGEIAAWNEIDGVAALGEEVFRELAAALALKQSPDLAQLTALLRATRAAKMTRSGIAAWERIGYAAEKDIFSSPLRALHALVRSMQAGVVKCLPTSVEFFEQSPILEWARKRGSVVFLDATLPLWLRRSIEHWGSTVVHAIAAQNISVERVTGCSYARGRPKLRGFRAYAKAMMHDYKTAAEQHARMGGLWAALVHQAHIVYGSEVEYDSADTRKKADIAAEFASEFRVATGCELGWFGAHDRGQDYWKYHNLMLFGQPLLGLVAAGDDDDGAGGSMATEYRLARAAALTAGDDVAAWPAEIGALDEPVAGQIPLPRDPQVRGWLVDRYAGDVVQAIGRARGARSPQTLRVELWGGVVSREIDQALAAHGIEIQTTRVNDVHVTQRGPRRGCVNAVEQAIDALEAVCAAVSVRAVREALRGLGLRARTDEIAQSVAAWKAAQACTQITKESSLSKLGTPDVTEITFVAGTASTVAVSATADPAASDEIEHARHGPRGRCSPVVNHQEIAA